VIPFLSVFPPYRGGIATFSDYLYTSLQHYDEVKAYNFKKLYPKLLFPGKSQIDSTKEADYALSLIHSMNPFNWSKTAHFIATENPDIILYSHWHPFFSPALWFILKKIKSLQPGIKIFGIAHNVLPHEYFPFQVPLIQKLFGISDQIILLSQQTAGEYTSLSFDTPHRKLFHPVYEQPIPDQSAEQLRAKHGIPKNDTVLIFFGLVRKYKGLDIMIAALNMLNLAELGITPLIVGEFYTDKKPILAKIRSEHRSRYHITDRFVSDCEAGEFLSLADAMVLPYRTASQSGVLSNAINFKLPVILPDLPGLTEHITNGETGLIFKAGNVNSLRKKILLFTENNLGPQMSDQMEKLKEKLTWSTFSEKLYNIMQS